MYNSQLSTDNVNTLINFSVLQTQIYDDETNIYVKEVYTPL